MVTSTEITASLPAVPIPTGVCVFGAAEVAYLIGRHAGSAPSRTASLLGVDTAAATGTLIEAGFSGLVARGLAMAGPAGRGTRDIAALVEYAAANSSSWITIDRITAKGLDRVLLLGGEYWLAAQLRAFATLMIGTPRADGADSLIIEILKESVALAPEASVAITAHSLDDVVASVFVRWDAEANAWDTVDRTLDPEAERRQSLSEIELTSVLARLVGQSGA